MKSCDFSRSFATFEASGSGNNARIQVEARCDLLDLKTGESENHYPVASCKGEDTHEKGCLFLSPSYNLGMIYSSTDFVILCTHVPADSDNTTVGDNGGDFLDVQFHISMVHAEALENARNVVQAAFASRVLGGRTEISDDEGRHRAVLEFPIRTMNVTDIHEEEFVSGRAECSMRKSSDDSSLCMIPRQ